MDLENTLPHSKFEQIIRIREYGSTLYIAIATVV